jgi:hypothetical protein
VVNERQGQGVIEIQVANIFCHLFDLPQRPLMLRDKEGENQLKARLPRQKSG